MKTLSYGYEKPENDDTGDVTYPAQERNIQRTNDHVHDGVSGKPLGSTTVAMPAASWTPAPIGGGVYVQTVAVPLGFSYDTCETWFKTSTGEIVYPTVLRVNAGSIKVYGNDNTLDYVAYFR